MSRSKLSCFFHGFILIIAAIGPLGYFLEVQERARTEALFGDAILSAGAGRWVWDLEAEKAGRPSLFWDPQMFVLFGRDPKKWTPNYGGFEACLLDEDRALVRKLCDDAITNKTGYNAVFSVVTENGDVRLLRASARVAKNGRHMSGLVLPSMQDPEFYGP